MIEREIEELKRDEFEKWLWLLREMINSQRYTEALDILRRIEVELWERICLEK
jgi:hypothetical protein